MQGFQCALEVVGPHQKARQASTPVHESPCTSFFTACQIARASRDKASVCDRCTCAQGFQCALEVVGPPSEGSAGISPGWVTLHWAVQPQQGVLGPGVSFALEVSSWVNQVWRFLR